MIPSLGVHLLSDDVILPSRSTLGSACFDIHAYLKEVVAIGPGDRALIPTGIIFDIPIGYSLRLHPRSGLSLKGITLANAEGVIDSDYCCETKIIIQNLSNSEFIIQNGIRICQAELVKNERFVFVLLKDKPEQKTTRDGGFGSTGE